jgi:hypothetical protein
MSRSLCATENLQEHSIQFESHLLLLLFRLPAGEDTVRNDIPKTVRENAYARMTKH